MPAPTLYNAHPITRELICTSFADLDPLDDTNWLIPAHAYIDAPPAVPAGHTVLRSENANSWQLVADHRGTVYDTVTGASHQYTELGELPAGLTTQPQPSPDHIWTGHAWEWDGARHAANLQALAARLCAAVDTTADRARAQVAGDPLRAVEYDRARIEAEAFAAGGYQGEVPRTVAAWAINGRTARQAADSILAEAAAYTEALYFLRETRLQAKEQIRAAMAAGNAELAQDIAAETIATIEAAVAGIGNNAGA